MSDACGHAVISESCSPLRTTGWALIQVDVVSCDATCDCMCIKVHVPC